MSIRGFDHVAITAADLERTLAFYRDALGAEVLYEELWRKGVIPVISLRLGANRINVHEAASPASPHAKRPTPGSQDLCFRWDGSVAQAVERLEAHGIAIVEGPVERPAADGELGVSIYFRDPDDNLLELLTTEPGNEGELR